MLAQKEIFRDTVSLVADPVRATILWTLLDGRAYTGTELAMAADTSASNISMHLAKLVKAGLLKVETQGRHRYYAFSGKEIAYAIEGLAALVPVNSKNLTEQEFEMPGIRLARSCYDHLAGRLGVMLTDALIKKKFIEQKNREMTVTTRGKKWFESLGIDTAELRQQRRSFLRPCLDWSERRYHMAGSLPAAFLETMLAGQWFRKTKNSRVLSVTSKGQKMLYEHLKISINQ